MLLALALAHAAPRLEVPPPNRLQGWFGDLSTAAGGDRVGMIVVGADTGPIHVEVWDGERWVAAREHRQVADTHVLVAELGHHVARVRLRSPDAARIESLDWDLFTPVPEPRGRSQRTRSTLPSQLASIGVVSRADWGAVDTTCTSVEDDWYRMAIHHTAGTQTYGGTVMGAVQVLQSYAMSSGEYCDIPYQFLVGYDGTLYEGRPYGYVSGATGGGNNDGNIAVCFLGCYHPSSCPNGAGDAVTESMIDGGQLLVQTLVSLHDVPSDADSIRGHRDWPGNSTACPGDWLYDRLDDLRDPLGPDYAGTLVGSTFGGTVSLHVGETMTGSFELLNTGRASWSPGATNLGTLPRDVASPVADATWLSTTRPTTIDSATAPGETGLFTFTVRAATVGEYNVAFAPVQEWVTWFADDGGPADGTLAFHVSVLAAEDTAPDTDAPDTSTDTSSDTPADDGGPAASATTPGEAVGTAEIGGCGCDTSGRVSPLVALLALPVLRRRR